MRRGSLFRPTTRILPGLVVAEAIIAALEELKLDYPRITGNALKELKKMERALKAQGPGRAAK